MARLEGDPFRIVLTDMAMPDMDGETMGKTIKADPELHNTLLVMMTSLGQLGHGKRLKDIGFSICLTKPVKKSQLYDCLATALGAGTTSRQTSPAAPLPPLTISPARRRQVRILLAEDNLTNQIVTISLLEKLGFRADAVSNGHEAIHALETRPYDIVFMDVQMPVMGGFEATQSIRSGLTKVANPRIPIVALTAHAMKGDRQACLGVGMDDYISKPIAPRALAMALEKWLDHEVLPSPSGPSRSVFDRKAFLELLTGDEQLAREIISTFLEDMSRQVGMLKDSIGGGDAELATRQAHLIKGASANTRCLALSTTAFDIEIAGKAGRMEAMTSLMSELEYQFQRLKTQLRDDVLSKAPEQMHTIS